MCMRRCVITHLASPMCVIDRPIGVKTATTKTTVPILCHFFSFSLFLFRARLNHLNNANRYRTKDLLLLLANLSVNSVFLSPSQCAAIRLSSSSSPCYFNLQRPCHFLSFRCCRALACLHTHTANEGSMYSSRSTPNGKLLWCAHVNVHLDAACIYACGDVPAPR